MATGHGSQRVGLEQVTGCTRLGSCTLTVPRPLTPPESGGVSYQYQSACLDALLPVPFRNYGGTL